jgi:hypothetical protein
MDNLLTVAFEAHHAERNHHRRYAVMIGRDLLNDWTVRICYGRTGQSGNEIHFASQNADELRTIIRDRLRRRLSAPRRIGCAYRITTLNSATGFGPSTWLPGDVMARFFAS